MKYLIKQAIIIPILFFIPVFIAGFLTDGYNLIEQHASEITLTDFENIIASKNREKAGFSVPAHGLYLTKVNYDYIIK